MSYYFTLRLLNYLAARCTCCRRKNCTVSINCNDIWKDLELVTVLDCCLRNISFGSVSDTDKSMDQNVIDSHNGLSMIMRELLKTWNFLLPS